MRFVRSFASALVILLVLAPVTVRAQARASSGWVGVVITTGVGQSNSSGSLVFNDYPVIESIDPGSPAEHAGLQAGDIIISLNSQDLRKNPIPMSSMIVPGKRILFKYMRDDVTRTSTVTVVERPVGTSGHTVLNIIGPAPDPAEPLTRTAREHALRGRTQVTLRERAATRPTLPLMSFPMIFGAGSPTIAIAGAELTQLNDGLREILKFKGNGVFVINVAMGTPAGEAGLKSGDVIVSANREAVGNPGEIVRMMRRTSERSMLLQIRRKQKAQTVTLRW